MQQRVPSPVRGIDVYKLPLTTLEGFVLSRVDGSASIEDISITCGIDKAQVLTILQRLSELGAVELGWLGPRVKRSTPREPASAPAARASMSAARDPDAHFAARAPRLPAAALDEAVQIPLETRKRILQAHLAMEGMDLYEVLGVPRDADKKAIRNAYFELSKLFHPDSYFGKELGSFKPRMEEVFKRLTEAYETLGKQRRRAEYDEYLAATEQSQRIRQTLESVDLTAEQVEAHRAATAPRAARGPAAPTPVPGASRPASAGTSSLRAMAPPSAPAAGPVAQTSLRPQPTTAERRARVRDRLLRQIRGGPSMRPSEPPPAAPPEAGGHRGQRQRSAIDGLRNSIRASAAVTSTASAQVQSHLRKAKEAEQAGDVLSAASQLQLALTIEPSNPDLIREYERVSKVVARNLAENYEKQALYEEKTGNWKSAARSWMRASDGRPEDAQAARRAAEAMLKAGLDLHRAQSYAQRAVQIDARNVQNLTVLARVYLAAGLKRNALRELEKAAQLAPKDEMVNNLLREVR